MGAGSEIDKPPVSRRATSAESAGETFVRKARRAGKIARRVALNVASGGAPETQVVFITGAQRSGTRVPLVALERAPDIVTYREGARPYFQDGRLTNDATLDALIQRCAFPVLVLKPLCESHRARQLLDRFPRARVLWIYRWYEDTINSASLKWRSGVEAVEQIVNDRLRPGDWRRGGLTPELQDIARRLYRPGLNLHHANAILWYLRNRLVLDLDLFSCDRALIVKYEDLSTDPAGHFPRVFDFIGQPFDREYVQQIHGNSVRRRPLPPMPEAVVNACEELYWEVDRRYQRALRRPS